MDDRWREAPESAQRKVQALTRALELSAVSVWRIDAAQQRVWFNTVGFDVERMVPDADGWRATAPPGGAGADC
jgi:hypothetical protein